VQQAVDGLQGAQHAELGLKDAADVRAAQRAHPVGLGRAGAQAVAQLALLVGGERAFAAAAGPVAQGIGAAPVVAGDPGADLPVGGQDLGGDGRRGLPEEGQADGGEAAGDLGPRLGTDEGGQLVGGVVRLDVQSGLLPGSR
jgi:hypothetical protein